MIRLPEAPTTIQKGVPLKTVLDRPAVSQMANNIQTVYAEFNSKGFVSDALKNIEPLSLTERSARIAEVLYQYLPQHYTEAIDVILKSLTPPLEKTEDNGLAPMFYMPHCHFIATYGLDAKYNSGADPFDLSMKAQYELTQRFTCEFSIRPFLIEQEERTLSVLSTWMHDPNPHVRRLCSEGTRPRLPWAMKLGSFADDPTPVLPILEQLKDDDVRYVTRSVANHVGDIAKDHLDLALDLCERWLKGASKELKWVIRHALRNPAKKQDQRSLELRAAAK